MKKGREKLGHILELLPGTSAPSLLPEHAGREARSVERRVRRGSPPGRFCSYAPLNASKTQVLMEVRKQLPRLKRMRTHPRKCNPNKFCLYHRDHSHDTEECI